MERSFKMKIFSDYESPFFNLLSQITDIVIVGMLWFLTSLPLITMGASTTAAYYVLTKQVSGKEDDMIKNFFKSFLENALRSISIFLLLGSALVLLSFNVSVTSVGSAFNWFILMFNYFLIFQVVIVMIYIFPLMARFKMRFFQYFKSACLLGNRHLLSSMAHLMLLGSLMLLSIQFIPLLAILMGVYCYLSSFMVVKIFRRYDPDFDSNGQRS